MSITNIVVNDPDVLSQLAGAEGVIVFRGPNGQCVRMAESVPLGKLPAGIVSPVSDEEFEEDTKRGSVLGSVVIGMERALRRREADLVIKEKLRVEKDATPYGDRPPEKTPEPTQEKPPS